MKPLEQGKLFRIKIDLVSRKSVGVCLREDPHLLENGVGVVPERVFVQPSCAVPVDQAFGLFV